MQMNIGKYTLDVSPHATGITWLGDAGEVSTIELNMDRTEQQAFITAITKCTNMQYDEHVQMKFGKYTIRVSSPSAQDTPDLQIVILWVRDNWISLEPTGLEAAVFITALKEALPK